MRLHHKETLSYPCIPLDISVRMLNTKGDAPGSKALILQGTPFILLGTAILWFGWFGFNGGSALQSNPVAVTAYINSQLAAGCAWAEVSRFRGVAGE